MKAALGPGFKESFALWFVDHAQHDNPQTPLARAHAVSLSGALQQGLRDLALWVEKGVRPPDSAYKMADGQVEIPASARARGGIQPVIDLRVSGGARAEAVVGELVTFTATIEVPPGAGKVINAEWDFEGAGECPAAADIGVPQALIRLSATHSYSRPSTYFPVLRAESHRDGKTQTPHARVQNLARVQVVVKAEDNQVPNPG